MVCQTGNIHVHLMRLYLLNGFMNRRTLGHVLHHIINPESDEIQTEACVALRRFDDWERLRANIMSEPEINLCSAAHSALFSEGAADV